VHLEKLEHDDVVDDGWDAAAAGREPAPTAFDASTTAFPAAPGAAMRTVQTRERIARMAGGEPGGRTASLVVLASPALEQVGLVIPTLSQAWDHRRIPIDQAVDPLI
jgi:hypothetical protein